MHDRLIELALHPVRIAASLAAPGGERGRLSILIYHRVRRERDPLFPGEVTAAEFDRQMQTLRRLFRVLPLEDAVNRLRDGVLPSRAVAITFDDGYSDNEDIALPILLKYGMEATFLIASGFLDGGRMWNDTVIEAVRRSRDDVLDLEDLGHGRYELQTLEARRRCVVDLLMRLKYLPEEARTRHVQQIAARDPARLPDDLMMTTTQLRRLSAAGMTVGGHTVSHPILSSLSDAAAEREIRLGKQVLEERLQREVRLFAYPNGKPGRDFAARHVAMAKRAGFAIALSTEPGVARREDDLFQLPRFTPWRQATGPYAMALIANALNAKRDSASGDRSAST